MWDKGLTLQAIADRFNEEEIADEVAPSEQEAPRKASWYPMKVNGSSTGWGSRTDADPAAAELPC
jgi:hypothetical protein